MKASDNPYPSLLFEEAVDPAAPAASHKRLFIDTDHHLKTIDSSSVVVDYTPGAAGAVATDAIWDAAGDLAVGTGADTAAKLAVGADSTVLTVSPSTHVPVWSAPSLAVVSTATVATSESTSSGSYTDLATAGPAVTVVVPASGKVRIAQTATCGATQGIVGCALSGANTVAAQDATGLAIHAIAGILALRHSAVTVMTGLTPGSTTFTLKYRAVGGGAVTFINREINVEPVN
jgi:hypothetical protein